MSLYFGTDSDMQGICPFPNSDWIINPFTAMHLKTHASIDW
jgi:hypothetical protein